MNDALKLQEEERERRFEYDTAEYDTADMPWSTMRSLSCTTKVAIRITHSVKDCNEFVALRRLTIRYELRQKSWQIS